MEKFTRLDGVALFAVRIALTAVLTVVSARLIEAADDLGLHLVTPRDETRRGGSVMLRLPDSHPAAQIVAALRNMGITTDARSQTLRLSPGNLTTLAGTETLIAALRPLLHTKA